MNASFIGGIIAVVVILLIIAVIKTYNHMVVLRNRVDNQGLLIETLHEFGVFSNEFHVGCIFRL